MQTSERLALPRRVLIANRGEIAVRVARSAAALGIESVAVYSAADEHSLHTRVADRRIALPGDPVAAYLDAEAVIDAARSLDCDLIHPGYGFLAEKASFVERCLEAGVGFVGPSPEAMAIFGDKVVARALANKHGVPTVPGSSEALTSAAHAGAVADELGYPVMLKAAAGGGGRGMRRVDGHDGIDEAFARASSEARAAFGDGSLLMEKLVVDPRHVEVQVLGDNTGAVIHLWERDCSLQQRHQKVIEIAPAPALSAGIRSSLLTDAVTMARAAGYTNAGTVEFLVTPGTDSTPAAHYFIECNPRIQVEHTITEQVTGVDLVECQFLLAAGATLADLGFADQAAVPEPRGFAVQARVVATSTGTLAAYREPSGPGVRVDGFAYNGYSPIGAFDPLLAKVIGFSTSPVAADPYQSFRSALDRTVRALDELHIDGIETNRSLLRTLLENETVRAGDARTTLIDALPAPAEEPVGDPIALFRSASSAPGGSTLEPAPPARPSLEVTGDRQPLVNPAAAAVVEVLVSVGDPVRQGQAVLVSTAMKMETVLTAPCSGVVADMVPLDVGDHIDPNQVLLLVEPGVDASESGDVEPADTWQPLLDEAAALRELAHDRLAPGSDDPGVVRQRGRGKLTCRERIDLLLDDGSFREIGSLAGFPSYDDDGAVAAFTPSNHVGGWGTVEKRRVVVCADDFTSRGGHADGSIASKARYLDQLSLHHRVPAIRLLDGSSGGGSVAAMVPSQSRSGRSTAEESTGAIEAGKPRVTGPGGSFLPPHLGSSMFAEQLDTVPVVNVLMGSVVGLGAAKAVLGHFSVMLRDTAQLFVAGPPVVIQATGEEIAKEELGGWHIHCRNGSVDNLAEDEADALAQTRRFLSYLPSSVYEPPPVLPVDPNDPGDAPVEELLTLVPRRRTTTFDIRRAIHLLVDRESFFEIGPLWGTDQVVGFARCCGHPIGVVASDSRHINGGALTADGCDKITRHLQLCDLFNIPVLNLVDNPGFAVGLDHEVAGTIRKGGEWMLAFARVSVPIFTVVMRRSFGVAGNNFASPRAMPDTRVFWPAADLGGIPPEGGIEAAYKRQLAEAEDPDAFRAELMERIESVRGPVGPLSRFEAEELIDPRDTRRLISEWIPTAYRIATHPRSLAPPTER